jgi:hypothetical protein
MKDQNSKDAVLSILNEAFHPTHVANAKSKNRLKFDAFARFMQHQNDELGFAINMNQIIKW